MIKRPHHSILLYRELKVNIYPNQISSNKQFCLKQIVYLCSMENELDILKGIHPGFFLANELRKRKLSKGQLALRIGEYPQVIGDITHGKRRLSPRIALKLDNAIGKEEGFFLLLQAWHDIYEEKRLQQKA